MLWTFWKLEKVPMKLMRHFNIIKQISFDQLAFNLNEIQADTL